MRVRILNSAVGIPGEIVNMGDAEATERIASGEVEPVTPAVERATAAPGETRPVRAPRRKTNP